MSYFSDSEKEEILQKLIHAQNSTSTNKYNKISLELINHSKFGTYFDENWHAIKDRWACSELRNKFTFRQLSNNFLESAHQKIKQKCGRKTSITDLIQTLISLGEEKTSKAKHFASKIKVKVEISL